MPLTSAPTSRIITGDALNVLQTIDSESVHCCVTSPPYYGLRDYGIEGQIGLEGTPEEYAAKMVEIFREVRRVLKSDGVIWLNLGDSYWGGKGANGSSKARRTAKERGYTQSGGTVMMETRPQDGAHDILKPKDLIGIPWMVAFALRADGYYLRSDIIWHKPNPMPESVKDRPTKSHEYMFLMSKSAKYYYNSEAIKEPIKDVNVARLMQDIENQTGSSRVPGKTNGNMKAVGRKTWDPKMAGGGTSIDGHNGYFKKNGELICGLTVNKKSVWQITTKPYKEAHFATFPPELPELCIKAGCPEGGTVLDPFNGAGTTGLVALRLNRNYIGIELNPEYVEISKKRIYNDAPLFNRVDG